MLYRSSVYVNNFDLSTLAGVAVFDYNVIEMASRNLTRSKLARADKSVLTSAEYVEKTITLTGIVSGPDKDTIETRFTALKGIVQAPEEVIRITYSQDDVEFTGTLQSSSFQWFGKHLKFTLTFLCSNPIGSARLTTNALTQTNTAASVTYQMTIGGSSKALPVITMTFDSLTGGTAKTVQVYNPATGQGISVTRNWTAGDILTIDSFEKTVTVGSTTVDYGGVFPSFLPGARELQYIDDLTTRSVDIVVDYKKQYA